MKTGMLIIKDGLVAAVSAGLVFLILNQIMPAPRLDWNRAWIWMVAIGGLIALVRFVDERLDILPEGTITPTRYRIWAALLALLALGVPLARIVPPANWGEYVFLLYLAGSAGWYLLGTIGFVIGLRLRGDNRRL
jgi:hypothetical protein